MSKSYCSKSEVTHLASKVDCPFLSKGYFAYIKWSSNALLRLFISFI